MENVAQDLSNIINTGNYSFHLKEETGRWQMFLKYELTTLQLSASEPAKEVGEARQEKWSSEQIEDFVRKLGFLDKDKEEGGGRITTFLHFNQASKSLERILLVLKLLYTHILCRVLPSCWSSTTSSVN